MNNKYILYIIAISVSLFASEPVTSHNESAITDSIAATGTRQATPSIPATTESASPSLRAVYIQKPQLIKTRIKPQVADLSHLNIGSLDGLSTIGDLKNQNIVSLSLHNNSLRTIKKDDFQGFSHLGTLALNDAQISSIEPRSFAPLSKLQALYLKNNPLVTITSAQLAGLNNLQTLYLNNTNLKRIGIDTFASTHNLKSLHLNDNKLADFDSQIIANLKQLKTLNLKNNPINPDKISTLKKQFPQVTIIF